MLRTVLVLTILAIGVGASLKNRFAALLLYTWFALFRPQEWMWTDISMFRPSLVLGLLLVVPCLLSGVLPNLTHPLSIGAALFFASSLLAQTNAVNPAVGWAWLDFLFRLLLVCLLAITLVSDQKRFKWMFGVVAGSLGFHAAKAGLASVLGGGVRFFAGFAGAFGDNNGYAVAMVMIAPLLFAVGQNLDRRPLRLGFFAAAVLTAFAVISTFSRGGFLALITAGLVMLVLQRRRVAAIVIATLVAVPVGVFMTKQSGYMDRVQTIRTYEQTDEESALSRLHFWRVAVRMAMDRPLGVGVFNYESAYDRYDFLDGAYGHNRSVHSSHFQVLAETGWLGSVAWGGLFFCAFRCALRSRRRAQRADLEPRDRRLFVTAANALIASMAAFVVGGAFVAMALNDLTWMIFALVASLDRVSAACCENLATEATPDLMGADVARWRRIRQGVA